ncbi:MAG: hypothetical protein HND48_14190 [Chloroflexi bacterium]|nr:hypothetical protein [Chloroflexota bacterium]
MIVGASVGAACADSVDPGAATTGVLSGSSTPVGIEAMVPGSGVAVMIRTTGVVFGSGEAVMISSTVANPAGDLLVSAGADPSMLTTTNATPAVIRTFSTTKMKKPRARMGYPPVL